MFSLFSLNPLNAIACRRTQRPVAIVLWTGLTGNRGICASVDLVFDLMVQAGTSLSFLFQNCPARHQSIWHISSSMLLRLIIPAARFGALTFGTLGFGTLELGTLIGQGDRAQRQYQQDALDHITNEPSIQGSIEYLLNPVFKSNSNVDSDMDSDPRQLTSGRYRFTPMPA